jgi:putative transposase
MAGSSRMSLDSKERHRRSIRVQGYDYSQPGAYFVTLVTYQREPLFGEITTGEMRLSPLGRLADENWRAIPVHFPQVELGAYVVMPNHLHGIIILTDVGMGAETPPQSRRGTIYRAPTDPRSPTEEDFQKPVVGSIPTIIRTYKASVTRRAGQELNETGIWQRNYYERIIRDEAEQERIHLYIEANVDNWATDDENPAAGPLP